jgi:hypothetical protein
MTKPAVTEVTSGLVGGHTNPPSLVMMTHMTDFVNRLEHYFPDSFGLVAQGESPPPPLTDQAG